MAKTNEYEYVTIIGSGYMFPIADLIKKLKDFPSKGVNQVQTSIRENGYSVSIIALIILYMSPL